MKSPGKTVVNVILAILLLAFLTLVISALTDPPFPGKSYAKNDVIHLATAFETEYGYLPGTGKQTVSGDLLAALMGSNAVITNKFLARWLQ